MLLINSGQYRFRFDSVPGFVRDALHLMYGDQPEEDRSGPADFRVSLRTDSWVRRFVHPQITFYSDQHAPFKPVSRSQGVPILEWGMNWCIAAHDYTRLLIHAAVVEKGGQAVIFPAVPGAGKSTLAAYLAMSGWNLYSDEMAVIDCATGTVSPLYRPVCLKNESIDLVKRWFPDAVMTKVAKDTRKGDIAHLKAMEWRRFKSLEPVSVRGIVFPKYQKDARLLARETDGLATFRQLCTHAFNYNILGQDAFRTMAQLTEKTGRYSVLYGNVKDVEEFLTAEFVA